MKSMINGDSPCLQRKMVSHTGKQSRSKAERCAPLCDTAGHRRMVNTGLAGQSDWMHSYSPPPLVFIQSPTPFKAVIISNTRLSLARAGNWAEISLHPGHKCCIYLKQAGPTWGGIVSERVSVTVRHIWIFFFFFFKADNIISRSK